MVADVLSVNSQHASTAGLISVERGLNDDGWTHTTLLQDQSMVLPAHGESHYKTLVRKRTRNFNLLFLTFEFFSGRRGRELLGAISRGLLDCPCQP